MNSRLSALLVMGLIAVPVVASAQQRATRLQRLHDWSHNYGAPRNLMPSSFRQAMQYTGQNAVRGARFVLKGGKWAGIVAGGAVIGAAAYSGVAGFLGADKVLHLGEGGVLIDGKTFDPSIAQHVMDKGVEYGKTAVETLSSREFLQLAVPALGASITYPIGIYAGGKALKAWRNNPYRGDTAVALMAVGGGALLGNHSAANMAINYVAGQATSAATRFAVDGAAKLAGH